MKVNKIKYPIGAFAPGSYMCKCANCGESFLGDKLSVQCEPCAINMVNDQFKKSSSELSKLKSELKKISLSNDAINKILNQ